MSEAPLAGTAPLAVGTIVRSDRLHGTPFGTVKDMRRQFRTGRGWGRVEYLVTHDLPRTKMGTWVDENHVQVAELAEVVAYYMGREDELRSRIKKLGALVGRKVPKFNPEKHLGGMAEHLSDAYRHEDGSITYVCYDPEAGDAESPRSYDGNVATLIQCNNRCIDLDDDDAGLREAYDRWDWVNDRAFFDYMPKYHDTSVNRVLHTMSREALMRRYLAMFRPDVLHYEEHWSAGESYGWGYVTREDWVRWMGEDYDGDVTPEQAFASEVRVYGLWARGEVYASGHVTRRGEDADMVFGHLGYDSSEDIARYHTDSPILEVLA